MTATQLEWSGALVGLCGAYMLAFNTRFSRYGWIAFLVANVAMISFALVISAHGLLVQQIGFSFASLIGMYKTGLIPFLKPKKSPTQ